MITVKSAELAHGHTGVDHLITGRECSDIVGMSYRSVRDARAAAEAEARKNADRRVMGAPIDLEVSFSDGTTRWVR